MVHSDDVHIFRKILTSCQQDGKNQMRWHEIRTKNVLKTIWAISRGAALCILSLAEYQSGTIARRPERTVARVSKCTRSQMHKRFQTCGALLSEVAKDVQ